MAKYIIDLNPDCVDGEFLKIPIRVAGENLWIKTKASLTPYNESDRSVIEDEVWATAIKIDIASEDWDWQEMTYREAKAKYDAWRAERDEIHVGDEVEYECCGEFVTLIVTGTVGKRAYGFKIFCDFDDVGEYCDIEDLRKTGRSFPEIADVLKKMREE